MASSVCTELIYVSFYLSAHIGVSISRKLLENVTSEFFPSIYCLSYLDSKMGVRGHIVLLSVVSWICSVQHIASLSIFHQLSSLSISFKSKWCSPTVVLIWLHLSVLSDFHMVNNQSIAVHAFPMHILTSLSVDEILVPRYINWSTYFRGLPFNMVWVPMVLCTGLQSWRKWVQTPVALLYSILN